MNAYERREIKSLSPAQRAELLADSHCAERLAELDEES